MVPQVSFSVLSIALLLAVASATDEDHDSVTFSYNGITNGIKNWGGLSPSFSPCTTGKNQSPVNIITKQTVFNRTFKPLAMNYSAAANATLVCSGNAIGVNYEEKVGDFVIDGKKYSLKQIHWHTPSEHRIDGKVFPAELHIVHEAEDRSAAVIAILYKYGRPDPLVKKVKKFLDKIAGSKSGVRIPIGNLDTNYIKKNTRKYYRYQGSFTTPPCTETVVWTIFGKVRTISKEQVEALRAPLDKESKNNARPLNPLNGRMIQLYSGGSGHRNNRRH